MYLIMTGVFFLLGFILLVTALGDSSSAGGTLAFASMILLFLGVVFLIAYIAGRNAIFEIAFPGGSVSFETRWHSPESLREFQRQIYLAKDRLKAGQTR